MANSNTASVAHRLLPILDWAPGYRRDWLFPDVLAGLALWAVMQPASDVFLGWVTAPSGRQFYIRQLHDAKIKPLVETFDAEMLDAYAQACGWVLARAHAKASGISAAISGYVGSSNDAFETAMGKFALAYADQAERDHAVLEAAVRKGKVTAIKDA
jgi:MFS superfamily sulfate permease-like transporter